MSICRITFSICEECKCNIFPFELTCKLCKLIHLLFNICTLLSANITNSPKIGFNRVLPFITKSIISIIRYRNFLVNLMWSHFNTINQALSSPFKGT